MIVDQAEKLRLMVRNTKKSAHVLAITSGKGGVGKTNVAANLGICLMAAGKSVILIDADLGLADRKSTRLNSSHIPLSRMPSSA